MREEGGRTVLMDFGAAKDPLQDASVDGGTGHDFAGTPLYVAPEVFAGSPRTPAADIYSLGVLLFHLVTGRYPVEGATLTAVGQAHRIGRRTYLRDQRPDLRDEFVQVVERALEPDPAKRYQSAGAFESALARFLGADTEHRATRTPGRAMAAVAVGVAVLAAVSVYWSITRGRAPQQTEPSSVAPASVVAPNAGTSYSIDAALYRAAGDGDSRLLPGTRVAPGDRLSLRVQVSQPTHLYVVNEDDKGESYLLFPLPEQQISNPIPPGRSVRLPAGDERSPLHWVVTSAGGREHFLIFATPEPLPAFDRMFATLPRPQLNTPVVAAPIPQDAIGVLRGVGGLAASARDAGRPKLADQFTTPLQQVPESASGLWVRQITLENSR
jgi:hypothetical protein